MLKRTTVICIALALCGCASSQTVQDNSYNLNHWVTPPQQGKLVIIGVSGRQFTFEEEIMAAREDAARKVAMYYNVRASSEMVQSIGSSFWDYYVDTQARLEYDQQFEKYMDKLIFDPKHDVINGEGVLLVRFTYPAAFPGEISYSSARKNPNGSPEWTTRPPQNIGNCIVGVGQSGRQLRFSDTVLKSHESAAAALVSRISTSIEIMDTSNSSNYQDNSVIIQRSMGELRHFLVIETWIDPDTLGVWTLAIAQDTQ